MSSIAQPVPTVAGDLRIVQWSVIFAGAVVAAAATSVTLTAFGGAIGLSIVSAAPTWRDTSPWLSMLSGLFLLFIDLSEFGFGGYVAGRMRHALRVRGPETEFRDGMRGILAWAWAIVVAALFAVVSAATIIPSAGSVNRNRIIG